MIDKETRKKLKQIKKKEISQLKKQIKKLEFRPCHNDSELKQKDKDIKTLREKTYGLEKEYDMYILETGNIKHSPKARTLFNISRNSTNRSPAVFLFPILSLTR